MQSRSEVSRESWTPPTTEPRADESWTPPTLPGLEFPGCTPRRMTYADLEAFDGRVEFWDARTATAWVCEPAPSPVHEEPSATLAATLSRIAEARGSPIKCFGSMGLMLRDARGEPRRVMQPDQSVYLRPLTAKLPRSPAMVIDEHDHPDVVLEVDHTTDVRKGKLKLYEEWGFPEIWIQVPTSPSPSRPKSRLPGLTIHLLVDGAYRESAVSRAFPGWRAGEIHAALDETVPSEETFRILARVGLRLGAREGTGPDDDPMARWLRRQARLEGIEQALAAHRESLRRQVESKFGSTAAVEFAHRLETVTDPSRLADIGVRIIDCATADELLG